MRVLDPSLNARLGEALKKAYGKTPVAWLLADADRDLIFDEPVPRDIPALTCNAAEIPLLMGLPLDRSGCEKSFLQLRELLHGSVQRIEV